MPRWLSTISYPTIREILQGVIIVEDFTPSDFSARKKALPTMRRAYEDGKKVRFFLLTEERFLSLSLVCALLTLYFVK